MAKHLPIDALIVLHNRLASLLPRDPIRRVILNEAAQFYGISVATLYRALHKQNQLKTVYRADYNHPRLITLEEMRHYCELIAALKLRTTNKKGHHLSTKECIRLLETYGIETPKGLVKVSPGLLKKTTISRYLKRFCLDRNSLNIQATVVHFQAEKSNECWQFDFSQSDFKRFFEDDKSDHPPTLMFASVVDDRSGVSYQEYHYVHGEDVMTALKFLFNAMAPKNHSGFPFQGIPGTIYMDNGPVAKSTVFKRVMAYLNIEVITHMPDGCDGRRKTSRAKGKVERKFRSSKNTLEPLYHLHPPKNVSEANEWLCHYLERCNQEKHRYENHSRLDDWIKNLPPEGFRAMCDWERFSSLAREPETRKVGSDACVNVNGVKYQLSGELSGLTVTLLWGLFDNELHVDYDGQHSGPYYPFAGPIPFGQYRPFKKSQREKHADRLGELAKVISVPRAALSGGHSIAEKLLDTAGLTFDVQPSVPFPQNNPFEQPLFKDAIEAKSAVARYLGFPLGSLLPEQLSAINEIIAETLDKQVVMVRVKQLFELRLVRIQVEGN